jgi:hypothetical protein
MPHTPGMSRKSSRADCKPTPWRRKPHDEEGAYRRSSRFHWPGQREAGESVAVSNQPRLLAGFGSEQVESVKDMCAVGAGDVATELRKVVAFQLR